MRKKSPKTKTKSGGNLSTFGRGLQHPNPLHLACSSRDFCSAGGNSAAPWHEPNTGREGFSLKQSTQVVFKCIYCTTLVLGKLNPAVSRPARPRGRQVHLLLRPRIDRSVAAGISGGADFPRVLIMISINTHCIYPRQNQQRANYIPGRDLFLPVGGSRGDRK